VVHMFWRVNVRGHLNHKIWRSASAGRLCSVSNRNWHQIERFRRGPECLRDAIGDSNEAMPFVGAGELMTGHVTRFVPF
jgi:hypothetical protein